MVASDWFARRGMFGRCLCGLVVQQLLQMVSHLSVEIWKGKGQRHVFKQCVKSVTVMVVPATFKCDVWSDRVFLRRYDICPPPELTHSYGAATLKMHQLQNCVRKTVPWTWFSLFTCNYRECCDTCLASVWSRFGYTTVLLLLEPVESDGVHSRTIMSCSHGPNMWSPGCW